MGALSSSLRLPLVATPSSAARLRYGKPRLQAARPCHSGWANRRASCCSQTEGRASCLGATPATRRWTSGSGTEVGAAASSKFTVASAHSSSHTHRTPCTWNDQAQQLAAVQETMRELGDDVLGFAMPGQLEMASDGTVGDGEPGAAAFAAAESEVRALASCRLFCSSRASLTHSRACSNSWSARGQLCWPCTRGLHRCFPSVAPGAARFGAASSAGRSRWQGAAAHG